MKTTNLLWLGLGLLVGVTGTVSTQLVLNELDNAPSSEWVIPHTAFGEHTVEATEIDYNLIFGEMDIPDFIENYDIILPYGEDYFVTEGIEQTIYNFDQTYSFIEYNFFRYNRNGLVTWSYAFSLEPGFATAAGQSYYAPFEFNHMILEGDNIIILAQFVNRLVLNDPIQNQQTLVENGNQFNIFGGGPAAGDYVQSLLRFNINTQQFTIIATDSSDRDLYDSEDFERLAPYRYALSQEFDNNDDEAFTYQYHGENLVFLEETNSIALLSEVTINPTNNTATFETKGKWSSTQSVDIDIFPLRTVKQVLTDIAEAELMVVNIYLNFDGEIFGDSREGSLFTAEDTILSAADQNMIDNAGARFIDEVDLEYLRFEYNAILDLDFNTISYELYEESKLYTSNYVYNWGEVYWIEENRFVFINHHEEQTNEGLSVSGNTIIEFKTGTRTTKTFTLTGFGDLIAYDFFMDDAGNMIIGGKLISNETYDISLFPRLFILFLNDDFALIDEFIFDSEDAGANLMRMLVDDNQIRAYFNINQHVGPFAEFPENQWDYLLTLELL